nr:hypothetical protein [Pseudohalocynthiibacter aestuariivivens]
MTYSLVSVQALGLAALVLAALHCSALAQTPNTESVRRYTLQLDGHRAGRSRRMPRSETPADLAETAYLRNGYRAILRILIAEEALASENLHLPAGSVHLGSGAHRPAPVQTSDNPHCRSRCSISTRKADALELRLRRPVRVNGDHS